MYRILINAGTENYYFIKDEFETPEKALETAMKYYQDFLIVKIIKFKAEE